MINKQNQKNQTNFVFKAGPGKYGKGEKQTTEDDFVELKPNTHIPSIPHIPSVSIYHQKKKPKFNYNQTLNILFFLCLISIIVLKFIINHLFITTHQKNFEDLISKLCFAFIGSYIFYNVVTKTTDKLKKKEAYAVICGLIDSVIYQGDNIKKWLLLGAGKDEQFSFEEMSIEDFKTFCSTVDINLVPKEYESNISNLIVSNGVSKVKFFIDKIFTYMPFLESELLHKLNKILNSKFSIYIVIIPYKQHPNLKEFSLEIFEFFELIKQLKVYNNKLKKKYLKNQYEKKEL